MMAHAHEEELNALLKTLSPNESRRLKKELETARDRGYAFDREENEPGVTCIGAPIFDDSEKPVAAISISGPSGRMSSQEREIAAALCHSCREISRQLGFIGLSRVRNGSKPALRLPRSASEKGLE